MEELIFQYLEIKTNSSHPIKHLRNQRDGAMALVRNASGQLTLGRKNTYPEGIAKMLGGGIEAGENPVQAMKRELKEEVGIQVEEEKIIPLIHVEVFGRVDGKEASFSVFVFYVQVYSALTAASDVDSLHYYSESEMNQLLKKFENLTEAGEIKSDSPATWRDWSEVWGPVHKAAFDRVKELSL